MFVFRLESLIHIIQFWNWILIKSKFQKLAISKKSTYTFLFKALNSFCYSCLFVVFCAYLEEWRRQKHIKKRIQDNHYLFKGGNMRMASDEDYGHVGRKNKDLGIEVILAQNSFGHYGFHNGLVLTGALLYLICYLIIS